MSGDTLSPTSGERIDTLDFIRGVAVMGIVLANIAAFGQPFSAAFYPKAFITPDAAWDQWAWLAQLVLIDGKLRGLFTLLFGAGLVLFMERASAKGAGSSLQLRRLFWLLCFGALHFVLLWQGDILMFYALTGVAALPFLGWSGRRLLLVGLGGYIAGALLLSLLYGFPALVAREEMAGDPVLGAQRTQIAAAQAVALAQEMREAAIIVGGDYLGFVRNNLIDLPGQVGFDIILTFAETLPLVLLGMGLFRLGLFTDGWPQRKLVWWSIAGIVAGGAATLALGLREVERGVTYYGAIWTIMGISMLPRLPMILGLAGLLTVLAPAASQSFGARVRAAGRMAFSNYLGTSFVMLWVFHGFGLGLFGQLNRLELYGVALGSAALMLLWSKPWLDRFRYGPLEWLWRCLTYGRRFPLRRESARGG